MGIVNVTPDSFSDGDKFLDVHRAVDYAHKLIEDGADIIDMGGESTRPGFTPISTDEELNRIMPVLTKLKDVDIPISIDTRNHSVMKEVLNNGASIINCVDTPTPNDPVFPLIKESGAGFVFTTRYATYHNDVANYDCIERDYGIANQMVLDLGIGFNKSLDEDSNLLKVLPNYAASRPILIGVSRKRIVGKICDEADPLQRLGGNIGAALWCVLNGAKILRVHDVKETRQAIDAFYALGADTNECVKKLLGKE